METHAEGLTAFVAQHFHVSREAVNQYIRKLVADGLIEAEGNTYARRYKIKHIVDFLFDVPITKGMYEHEVWQEQIVPRLAPLPNNIIDICQHGFTEILNNVIDHSQSPNASIHIAQTYNKIKITIVDNGVGIFEKIQRDFNLPDSRTALLELSKGKLTSDKIHHSGEGIFFTSRMFEIFIIMSSKLFYQRTRDDNDEWAIEILDEQYSRKGTFVEMDISTDALWTSKEIFEKYQDDDYRFTKTHVPIMLGKYGDEQLVSRSQAKRVLSHSRTLRKYFWISMM